MSYSKMDPVFQGEKQEKIAKIIAQILREEYGEVGGAVKRIARKIDANPRTVKNWYEGRRAPSLGNYYLELKRMR
uniref:HTH cro/C1-type domain-containing protein n=1 Tax=OCS116 cluster bacterium TaxID=2030921 RepID=A0A2A4YZV1_9PROT